MRIDIDTNSTQPRYQQIVAQLEAEIRSGVLSPGTRLPTVRELAVENTLSPGTVKQAYDTLERLGLVDKTQGRGTFVSRPQQESGSTSHKQLAMEAIDRLFSELLALQIPLRDIRIFLDLKLREREMDEPAARIGLIDCSPEALSVLHDQLAEIAGVDVFEYLLDNVLQNPALPGPGLDLLVTTNTHSAQLAESLPGRPLSAVAMAVSAETVAQLARVPEGARLGILCASERFGGIMARACEKYCLLEGPPEVAYFTNADAAQALLQGSDIVVLPANYERLCPPATAALINAHTADTLLVIYRYEMDRGSQLALYGQIHKMAQRKNRG